MKRLLLWTSFGMLLYMILSKFVPPVISICVLLFLSVSLFLYDRTFGIFFLIGCLLGAFCSFCYETASSRILSNMSETEILCGTVKECKEYGFMLRISDYGNESGLHSAKNLYSFYCFVYSEDIPKNGSYLVIEGEPEDFSVSMNPGQFNAKEYYASIGCLYAVKARNISVIKKPSIFRQVLDSLRESIYKKLQFLFPTDTLGICKAVLLGDKADLGEEQKDLYEKFGLAHILAVSGLHIGIFSSLLLSFLMLFLNRKRAENSTIVFLLAYGLLCNFSVSSIRAIFCFILTVVARRVGRTYDSLSANAFLLIAVLFIAPYRLDNLSFQLSFAAGFLLGISKYADHNSERSKVTELFRTSLILHTGLLPIELCSFYTFTPIGIVINLILLAFIESAFGLLLIALVVSYPFPLAGRFFAGSVHYFFTLLQKLLEGMGRIKGVTLTMGHPKLSISILFYCVFLSGLYYERRKSQKYIWILCFSWLLFYPFFRPVRVINLSVGQGDCSLFLEKNQAIMIDCGSSDIKNVGEKILKPALAYYGYDHLDYVFFSHLDSDHTNGLMASSLFVDTKAFFLAEYFSDYEELAVTYGIPKKRIVLAGNGDSIKIGTISFQVLQKEDEDSTDANEYCQMLRVNVLGKNFLFLGDVSKNVLQELDYGDSDIYLVKVAHHGSAGSLCEQFYQEMLPCVSIVSVGRNSYGHPSKEVVSILNETSGKCYITNRNGAILTVIKRHSITSKCYINGN